MALVDYRDIFVALLTCKKYMLWICVVVTYVGCACLNGLHEWMWEIWLVNYAGWLGIWIEYPVKSLGPVDTRYTIVAMWYRVSRDMDRI